MNIVMLWLIAHLKRIAERRGVFVVPIEVRSPSHPSLIGVGLLMLGARDESIKIARLAGVHAVVQVSGDGDLSVLPLRAV